MTHEDPKAMGLVEHLLELRTRLFYGLIPFVAAFGVCYYFADTLFLFLAKPLIQASPGGIKMIYTGMAEAFLTYVKVALYGALFISFPFLAWQLWTFVAPGLYRHERRAFLPFLILTPVLFLLGASLAYYFVFPLAWDFFASFQIIDPTAGVSLHLEPKANEYVSLSMKMIFAFGLCFQMPILLALMARAGMVQAASLRSKRRYMIVIFFTLAAILTPPDVVSQIGLAIPLILLYEVSIVWVARQEKKNFTKDDIT